MCDGSDGNNLDRKKEAELNQAITSFMQPPFFNDICIRIVTVDSINGQRNKEQILANKFLLAFFSLHIRELILNGAYSIENNNNNGIIQNIPTIELHLGTTANAGQAFRIILRYLYTGILQFGTVHPVQVLQVSRLCQIPMVEMQIMAFAKLFLSNHFDGSNFFIRQHNTMARSSNFLNLTKQRHCMKRESEKPLKICAQNDLMSNKLLSASSKKQFSGSVTQTENSGKSNELVLPSNEKEGWCRNKKYIEQVENGYMCTVCHKVYGRYNSVSYHVTIYHRNSPIKCDEKGCPFRTREARYIHFHKYYRHHIPLPDSIDLGSRKCPFCRHVSKSPAMLEKHISRHVQDVNRVTAVAGMQCTNITPTYTQAVPDSQCSKCNYRGRTADDLQEHNSFVHSKETLQLKQTTLVTTTSNRSNLSSGISQRRGKVNVVEGTEEIGNMKDISSIEHRRSLERDMQCCS